MITFYCQILLLNKKYMEELLYTLKDARSCVANKMVFTELGQKRMELKSL